MSLGDEESLDAVLSLSKDEGHKLKETLLTIMRL